MRAGFDAKLKRGTPIRREALQQVGENVAVLCGQRREVGGITSVRRQAEGWPLLGEGDATDEELRAVGKRDAGVGEAGQGTVCPGGLDPCREGGDGS
jgi:hypothetical protein